MIFFFYTIDYSIIIFFLILAAILGYKVAVLFQGIFSIIVTLFFIFEVLACLFSFFITKPFLESKNMLLKLIDKILTFISSIACLRFSYLLLTELKSYGSSFFEIIDFLFVLVFGGIPLLMVIGGWAGFISSENGDDYIKSFFMELAGVGIFHLMGIR